MIKPLGSSLILGAMLVALTTPAQASSEVEREQAMAQRHAHQYEAAEATLQGALKRNPGDFALLCEIARFKDYVGDYADALHYYRKALVVTPNDFATQVMAAHEEIMLTHYDQALKACEGLMGHPERQSAPRWAQSRLFVTLGSAKAMKSMEGGWSMLRYGFSIKQDFETAYRLDPDYPRAGFGLGMLEVKAPPFAGGNMAHGMTLVTKAARMDPDDWTIRGNYVQILLDSKAPEAKAQQERWVSDFGKNPGARKQFPKLFKVAEGN
jgi:tetratricopeptide (TPR) repeat protein